MVAKQIKEPPVFDIPYFHKGHYDHMVRHHDLDAINEYRNHAKEFVANFIVKQGMDIAKRRVQSA